MDFKKFLCLMIFAVFVFVGVPNVFADTTSDAILKLLIKKGLITEQEVNSLKTEVAEKPCPASWFKNIEFKGDIRLRNDYLSNDEGQDNNRQRLRFRLGATAKINDQWKGGFGIATGNGSATSTNQTLESSFSAKDLWLDYAYATYTPTEWVEFTGGKFQSPFLHTDMLWDSDARFDGFAAKVKKDLLSDSDFPTQGFVTIGYFPIDDNYTSEGNDLYLLAGQVGTTTKFNEGYAKLKTGLAYYAFENVQGKTPPITAKGNTLSGTSYANGYDVLVTTAQLAFKDLLGAVDVPWGVFGEYGNNLDTDNDEQAWRLGLRLGQEKPAKIGDWTLIAQYSRLEKDAFLDIFPDADLNSGGTDGKGYELILDYVVADNVTLSLDYYNTERISSPGKDEQILQADVIVKF